MDEQLDDARAIDEVATLLETLVESTERLHAGALDDAPLDRLQQAIEERERAFARLRELVDPETFRPNAALRVFLERLRALDADLIALGASLPDVLRGRRHALHRRRSAIQAHAARTRVEPRVVTVKA